MNWTRIGVLSSLGCASLVLVAMSRHMGGKQERVPTVLAASPQNQLQEQEKAQERQSSFNCRLPEVRKELLRRLKVDQEARQALIDTQHGSGSGDNLPVPPEIVEHLRKVDKDNRVWLAKQLKKHGWLGKSLVGKDGAHAAWLLAQHADADLEFQSKCLKLMREAKEGEVAPVDIAYLTDRVLAAQGKPQRYGTQVIMVNGQFRVKEVESPEELDARRKELGMPPMAEYLKQMKKLYSQPKAEPPSTENASQSNEDQPREDQLNRGKAKRQAL